MKIKTDVWYDPHCHSAVAMNKNNDVWYDPHCHSAVAMNKNNEIVTLESGFYWQEINPADFNQQDNLYPMTFEFVKLNFKKTFIDGKVKKLHTYQITPSSLFPPFLIKLSWFQNHKFLWMQNTHWFQKEDNIRFLVNIFFLILGTISLFKTLNT